MHPPTDRLAGLLIPAFTPRRDGDLGIGDTLALREWIDWAAEHEVGFIQLLPINENGVEESPYSAISSVALDPIYLTIQPGEIPGLASWEIDEVRTGLGGAVDSPLVNYPAVRKAKRDLLELAWSRFGEAAKPLQREFARFRKEERAWLDDYCLFRWLMDLHGCELRWDQWPAACQTPADARRFLASQRKSDAAGTDGRTGFFAFVQWLCFRQWLDLRAHATTRGVKLMGDVPIGVSWHSCDVFFDRDEFHLDWCGGSPPEGSGQDDAFFQQWGQNWGIPLYRWDHMEKNGYVWWRRRIARVTRFFDIFRLDHILGFYRIYAFPWHPDRNHEFIGLNHEQAAGLTGGHLPKWWLRPDDSAENQAANRADGDARLRAIIAAAGSADIIAEDLGWVPEYVRPHLYDLDIACYRIPHWDSHDGHPAPGHTFQENSFATYSTHDHDPINSIWRGCERVLRQHHDDPTDQTAWAAGGAHFTLRVLSEFAGIPVRLDTPFPPYTEGVRLRLIKALLDSNSRFACYMITGLFSLDERFNHPGTSGGENWRFRLPWTLAEIESDPHLEAVGRKFSTLISLSNRGRGR